MVGDALEDADLVQLQYALLVFLDDVPGISQQSLSEALGIHRNNVSLIVDKLEARGLLKEGCTVPIAGPANSTITRRAGSCGVAAGEIRPGQRSNSDRAEG